jgi:flavorubredoxin/flavin reductase (DIM6/NTAB) family NADH-FMN oxidoreductase RutF
VAASVAVLPLGAGTALVRCATRDRLRLALEFALKRGTTDNCYLLTGADATALVDVPEAPFAPLFAKAVAKEAPQLAFIVLTHFSARRADALAQLLLARPTGAPAVEVWCTNPAAKTIRVRQSCVVPSLVLRSHFLYPAQELLAEGPGGNAALRAAWRCPGGLRARLRTVRGGDMLSLGAGRTLRFAVAPTPRWPDAMLAHDAASATLFSGKLFSAHVYAPPASSDGDNDASSPFDDGGWDTFGNDWRYFFEALLAPMAKQASVALERADIRITPAAAPPLRASSGFLDALAAAFKPLLALLGVKEAVEAPASGAADAAASAQAGLSAATLAPLHGPVVRAAAAELLSRYGEWCAAQVAAADVASVAVIYASAYGNTGALAGALCRGVTKAGAAAVQMNAEFATPEEIAALVEKSDGFMVGSPTLGGHMPTPVKSALGAILRLPAGARAKPCGVFGSFGWSGEAVDEIEAKLRDGGFTSAAFKPIRCKFAPTEAVLQACEEAGTDLAQAVLRGVRQRSAATARAAASTRDTEANAAAAAMGRVVGSMCVLTARSGDAESGMLASWVSQAGFNPPSLTVAVAKDRAVESLVLPGAAFALNVLAAGSEKATMKALLKPFAPGESRFEGLEIKPGPITGAPLLSAASAAYLECQVADRMDAGDHWIILATVQDGGVVREDALTAVHHRRSGANY